MRQPIEDLQGLRTRVFLGYGSTETITHVALRQLNGPERSTMFTALGDITFARDERGCLIVHTPHLTVKEHVTNDMVDLLDNRHFRWQGRHDNVILSGGKDSSRAIGSEDRRACPLSALLRRVPGRQAWRGRNAGAGDERPGRNRGAGSARYPEGRP